MDGEMAEFEFDPWLYRRDCVSSPTNQGLERDTGRPDMADVKSRRYCQSILKRQGVYLPRVAVAEWRLVYVPLGGTQRAISIRCGGRCSSGPRLNMYGCQRGDTPRTEEVNLARNFTGPTGRVAATATVASAPTRSTPANALVAKRNTFGEPRQFSFMMFGPRLARSPMSASWLRNKEF